MKDLNILVVDDQELWRHNIAKHLAGHRVSFARDEAEARKYLATNRPDVCFIDINLGPEDDCSGLNIVPLAAAKGSFPVIMSSNDTEEFVQRGLDLGARDFFSKGNTAKNIQTALALYRQERQKGKVAPELAGRYVSVDQETRAGIDEARKYAASDLPILLLGPSGTGKTCLARILHDESGRSGQFVAINCSSYTPDLLEAELFGYRKGAFTDAKEDRKGKLLLADNGTLFLDEIGSMSVKMQTKLLKALEERTYYPLGSEKPESSQFRIMSATLEDVPGLLNSGKLRGDFFQRIHGLTVELKPLAERSCDIFPLIDSFTQGGRKLLFSAQAKERLLRHSWPGNIRELQRLVELLVAGSAARVTGEVVEHLLAKVSLQDRSSMLASAVYSYAKEHGLQAALQRVGEEVITRCLAENNGKVRKVLLDLHMSSSMLYDALERIKDRGGVVS